MPEQFAPPSRFPPRSGNAGDGSGGEIRALSSSPAGLGFDDWRRDLGVLKERGRVRHKIFWILFDYVSLECEEEMAEFSNALEEINKETYLDQLSFSTRVRRLIQCAFINRIIHKKRNVRARCILHPSPAAVSPSKAENGTVRSHSLVICTNNVNQPHSRFRSATSSGSKGKGFGLGVFASDMIRKQASGTISSTDEGDRRKRAFCIAEMSPIGHKRFKADNLLSITSCIPGAPTTVYSPDGPLSMQQTLFSSTSSNSGVIELTMEVDTVHGEQPVNSAITKESTDHILRSNAGEVHNVAEVLPADCRKIEPTRTWDVIFESEVSFGTIGPKIVPNLSQEQHIAEKDDTVVTAQFDEAPPRNKY